MNKKQRIIIIAAAAVLAMAGAAGIVYRTAHKNQTEELLSIHERETESSLQVPEVTETAKPEPESSQESQKVETMAEYKMDFKTYVNEGVSIQYPQLSGMGDEELQKSINDRLFGNAVAIIKSYPVELQKDQLDVKAEVNYLDRRRISVSYRGILTQNGKNVNVFYTNTVDLKTANSMNLLHFADPAAMAAYVFSGNCMFEGADAQKKEQLLTNIKETMTEEELAEILENGDFPLKKAEVWPKSFCYENQGNIYFSVPVSSELGDYTIVKYVPNTK